jgi:hypothetical protein
MFKKSFYFFTPGGELVIRQTIEENLAVTRLGNPIVQQGQQPAI